MIIRVLQRALQALICVELLRMLTVSRSLPLTLCTAIGSFLGWRLGAWIRPLGYLTCQAVRGLLIVSTFAAAASWHGRSDLEIAVLAYLAVACGVMIGITPPTGGGDRSRRTRPGQSLVRSLFAPQARA